VWGCFSGCFSGWVVVVCYDVVMVFVWVIDGVFFGRRVGVSGVGVPEVRVLYEISGVLSRLGSNLCGVIGFCPDCEVSWSFWGDKACWYCGGVGFLRSPLDVRVLLGLVEV
jgi:hypothetical protein